VGKPEGKKLLGRPRHRLVHIIEMNVRELDWSRVDWTDVAEDGDQWRALVNTEMHLRIL
jgi:hypothetical protein